jgi:predicted porin
MKKLFLSLAVLGASCAANAQSSVTIYGIVDAGLVRESGGAAGSVTKLTSGVAAGSRIGFRGVEDLGGGLSAKFLLENGFATDTGAITQGNMWGRQAYVGLDGGFGSVTFGRMHSPYLNAILQVADPFVNGYAPNAGNLMLSVDMLRINNAVRYGSPVVGGFSGEVVYGFGEVAGNTSASRVAAGSVSYANGPLNVRLVHNNANNATATDSAKKTMLAANYNFGVATAYLAYAVNKGAGTLDSSDLLVGAAVPFGPGKILASYIRKDDKSNLNRDADQYGIGYSYSLSKRTELYTSYARIKNKNGAAYTVGNATELGSGDKAFNVGVRHNF